MTLDTVATNSLVTNPKKFIAHNFVGVTGQGGLAQKILIGKRNRPHANKYLGNVRATIVRTDNRLQILHPDLVTCTNIGGRHHPTVFFGLEKISDNNYQLEVSSNQDAGHPSEGFYLPASANQIVGIKLRNQHGPALAFTDPITGCSIFVTNQQNHQWILHANGVAVAPGQGNNDALIYMRKLYRRWSRNLAPPHTLVSYFDRNYYEPHRDQQIATVKQKKQNMGRDVNKMYVTETPYSVVGIRDNHSWDFYWQKSFEIHSERTGVKKVFMGKKSNKRRLVYGALPTVAQFPCSNP